MSVEVSDGALSRTDVKFFSDKFAEMDHLKDNPHKKRDHFGAFDGNSEDEYKNILDKLVSNLRDRATTYLLLYAPIHTRHRYIQYFKPMKEVDDDIYTYIEVFEEKGISPDEVMLALESIYGVDRVLLYFEIYASENRVSKYIEYSTSPAVSDARTLRDYFGLMDELEAGSVEFGEQIRFILLHYSSKEVVKFLINNATRDTRARYIHYFKPMKQWGVELHDMFNEADKSDDLGEMVVGIKDHHTMKHILFYLDVYADQERYDRYIDYFTL